MMLLDSTDPPRASQASISVSHFLAALSSRKHDWTERILRYFEGLNLTTACAKRYRFSKDLDR